MQIRAPAAMCHFGMSLKHLLHAFEKPTGFGVTGSDTDSCLLLTDQLLLLHKHAMTTHASSHPSQLVPVSL